MIAIKFRAWHKEEKNMYRVMGISYYNVELDITLDDIQFVTVDAGASYLINEVKLMRYTGIPDKNGKEICEGDILETNEDTLVCIEWYDESHCLSIKEIGSEFRWYLNKVLNNCFIVGNIYENPELLEVI